MLVGAEWRTGGNSISAVILMLFKAISTSSFDQYLNKIAINPKNAWRLARRQNLYGLNFKIFPNALHSDDMQKTPTCIQGKGMRMFAKSFLFLLVQFRGSTVFFWH